MTFIKKALVLGSHGLIGKALVKKLIHNGIEAIPYDIKIEDKYDLSFKDNLYKKNILYEHVNKSDFVFFLAYDVGGSKYLESKQNNYNFISNNMRIMDNVFEVLNIQQKPFIFASSMMAEMAHSSYGNLKKVGEYYTKNINGVSARFWNVFGDEEYGIKSHIIPDLINQYYEQDPFNKKEIIIKLLTDGSELRQFISSDKAADALITIMKNYKAAQTEKDNVIDISNGHWINIEDISNKTLKMAKNALSDYFGITAADFILIKGSKKDQVQKETLIQPNITTITKMNWGPKEDLEKLLYDIALVNCKKLKK